MSLIKPRKYAWIGPICSVILGILYLTNRALSSNLRVSWYILLPIAVVISIMGIIAHVKTNKEDQTLLTID
jgi:hypothetical protein